MLAGIRDILIILTLRDIKLYEKLFGEGGHVGLNFTYEIQEHLNGLAESFIIGEEFIGKDSVCLVSDDNIFYGHGLTDTLKNATANKSGATIFGYPVKDTALLSLMNYTME